MHCVQTLFDTSGMLLIFIYYSMCTLLLYTDYIFRKVLSQLVFLLIVFVFLIDHFNGLCTIVTCIAFLLTRKARCLKLFYQLINEQPCLLFFFLSSQSSSPAQRCELSVQRTEKGTLLHICSLPEVMWFVECILTVTESFTNATIYTRTVVMNDHGKISCLFKTEFFIT